jgi:signal peptide peptidase SppA
MTYAPDAPDVTLEIPRDADPVMAIEAMYPNGTSRLLVASTHVHALRSGRSIRRTDVQRTRPLALVSATLAAGAEAAMPNDARPFQVSDGVAYFKIEGPLAREGGSYFWWSWQGYDQIQAAVEQALGAKDVNALVLVIDSPGGEVSGCFDCVRRIRAAKEASGKPIIAYCDPLAASAAYAIASAADRIVVSDTGEVGSIGVIMSMFEYSKAYEAEGIKPNIITSGELKATGHHAIEMTDRQREAVQRDIDQLAEIFAKEVVAGRGGTAKQWLGLEADTRIGTAAVDAKLADAIGDLDTAAQLASQLAGKSKRASAERGAGDLTASTATTFDLAPLTPIESADAKLARGTTTDGQSNRSSAAPSPGDSTTMTTSATRSMLALALCAALSMSVTATDEELIKKFDAREAERRKADEEHNELLVALGAKDTPSAKLAVTELKLAKATLDDKLAQEAEAAKAEALRKEEEAKVKAKADADRKASLLADAHKRGLVSAATIELLEDLPLARVEAHIAKCSPVGGKPLEEPPAAKTAERNAEGRELFNGKTFEQITSVSEMLKLEQEEPELYARMRADAVKRGFAKG